MIGQLSVLGYIGICVATGFYASMWGTPSWIGVFSYGMG